MDLAHRFKRIFGTGLGQHHQRIMIGFKPLCQTFDLGKKARIAVIADFGGIQDRTDLHGFAGAQHHAPCIRAIADFRCCCLDLGDRVGFDLGAVFKGARHSCNRQAKPVGNRAQVGARSRHVRSVLMFFPTM